MSEVFYHNEYYEQACLGTPTRPQHKLSKTRSLDHSMIQDPLLSQAGFYGNHRVDLEEPNENARIDHIVLHARVYVLAEKYDVPTLQHLAKAKLVDELSRCTHVLTEAIHDVVVDDAELSSVLLDLCRPGQENAPQPSYTAEMCETRG